MWMGEDCQNIQKSPTHVFSLEKMTLRDPETFSSFGSALLKVYHVYTTVLYCANRCVGFFRNLRRWCPILRMRSMKIFGGLLALSLPAFVCSGE